MKTKVFLLLVLVSGLAGRCLATSEADSLILEEFDNVQPLELGADGIRCASAMALYLQALVEEESEGPDKALETKRKVLELDPGFSSLAVESANQYLRRNETTEAIAVLKDAAKANPKNIDPALALSAIYLRQLNKPELAEKYASVALAAKPDEPGGYEALWAVYRSAGQNAKIDGLFQRARKREFAKPDFWVDLAALRLRDASAKGKLSDEENAAVVDFLDRAAQGATDARSLARMGDYFVIVRQPSRAADLYTMALKLRPNLEGVRNRLAACLLQSDSPMDAVPLLEENVKTNPLDIASYDLLGKIFWEIGKTDKALANLRQSLLIAPPDPKRYDDVLRLSFTNGDWKGALETAIEAGKTFPQALEFTIYRAMAQSELDNHESAMSSFEEAEVAAGVGRPDLLNADFYFSYGAAAEQAGRYVKAAQLFQKSIALDPPRSARACNYLGYMWADRNENLDEAEKLIRRALELEPGTGAYLDSLGWTLFRKGQYDEALTELLRATAALDTPDPVVWEHVGDTYEKLGKIAEAVQYWQKALQVDPTSHSLTAKIDAHSSRIAAQPKPTTPQTPAR